MKNVIYVNDALIGTYEDIWKSYKEELKRQMDDNTISFEELKRNFMDILDVMEQMEDDINIYPNTLVIIKENAMGNLYYKRLEEID